MITFLDGLAVVDDDHLVGVTDSAQAVDDDEAGATIGMGFSALAYGITLLFRRKELLQGPLTNDAIVFQLAASVFVGLSTWLRWIALNKAPVSVVLALGRLNVPVVIQLSPMFVGKARENVTARVWLGTALIVGGSIILNYYG